MTHTIRLLGLAVSATLLFTGCITSGDLSNSSKWSSNSSSSPFRSSSRSSGGEDEEESSYRQDVTSVTLAYLEAGRAGGDLLRDLSRVAEQHGITDWEGRPSTFVAIGVGLRRGGVDPADVSAFSERLFGPDVGVLGHILEGYHS